MDDEFIPSIVLENDPELTEEVRKLLEKQNLKSAHVTEGEKIKHALKIKKIEKEAEKNWNTFYKRNTTNFFKDR
jgi:methyltransferase-like protein 6